MLIRNEWRHKTTNIKPFIVFHYDQKCTLNCPLIPHRLIWSSILQSPYTHNIFILIFLPQKCFLVAHNNILLITRCSLVNWKQKLIYYPHITLNVRYEKAHIEHTIRARIRYFPTTIHTFAKMVSLAKRNEKRTVCFVGYGIILKRRVKIHYGVLNMCSHHHPLLSWHFPSYTLFHICEMLLKNGRIFHNRVINAHNITVQLWRTRMLIVTFLLLE